MALLATSPPDGTIFYGTTPTFINTSILSDVEYTYEDLEPLVNVFLDPQIVYTRGDSPFNSLAEVIEAAKADPGHAALGRQHAGLARPAGHGAAEGADRRRRDHRHPRGRRRPADQRAERHPRRRRRRDPGAASARSRRARSSSSPATPRSGSTRYPDLHDRARAGHRPRGRQVPRPRRAQGPARRRVAAWEERDPARCSRMPEFKAYYRRAPSFRRSCRTTSTAAFIERVRRGAEGVHGGVRHHRRVSGESGGQRCDAGTRASRSASSSSPASTGSAPTRSRSAGSRASSARRRCPRALARQPRGPFAAADRAGPAGGRAGPPARPRRDEGDGDGDRRAPARARHAADRHRPTSRWSARSATCRRSRCCCWRPRATSGGRGLLELGSWSRRAAPSLLT